MAKREEFDPHRREFLRRAAIFATAGAGAAMTNSCISPFVQNEGLDGEPVPDIAPPASYGLSDIEAKTLTTSQGEEFLTWQSTNLQPGKKTLVFFPGNYGHLGHENAYIDLINKAQEVGYQIVAVNHVGFAGSKAESTEESIFRGVETTLQTLLEKGFKINDLHLAGISMGTTLAAHAANYLANSSAFKNDSKQHIRCELVNGIIDAKVAIDDMLPPVLSETAWLLLKGRLDTGKELQSIDQANGKRVHVTFVRGNDDKYTPQDQIQAHQEAAAHLDFKGIELPGEHFTIDPSALLSQFKQMGVDSPAWHR